MSNTTIERRNSLKSQLAPGARVEVRNEEWIVKQCYYDEDSGANVLKVKGISGLVRGMNMVFLDSLDEIKIVDPLKVSFDLDLTPNYRRTKLFIDTWLRKTIPDTNNLVIGHRGVFKDTSYQFKPAVQALDQNKNIRPRILMADAVGMGKTIQVGVLLSELIRRGKANRILVVGLKSMLTQLQKELWSRFTIPLKMMDSNKIEQVYRDIPSGMNPLNYYDKVIISMDTLKIGRNLKYLENSHWDVIVIDECHNVSSRGKSASIRSKLAKKLAAASDSLILTSATPHDGTRESYSSLLDLLDPTLVVDPKDITKDTLNDSGVVIRRFRSSPEVKDEIDAKERNEDPKWVPVDKTIESALLKLVDKTFKVLDEKKSRKKDIFFRSTLSKALFSSPEAFISSIDNRLEKLVKVNSPLHIEDKDYLEDLKAPFKKYRISDTPKYKELLKLLKEKMANKERVVIFSEYRKTQLALLEALAEDLKLKMQEEPNRFEAKKTKAEIVGFNADVPENEQQEIIEAFAAEGGKIKVLVTTDIASEGVNLHYACHNLVHFDVPWSFITLEQRNGRIDRFGQAHQPNIYYLVYESAKAEVAKYTEKRVVVKLLDRAKTARDQQGDIRLAMQCFDAEVEDQKLTVAYQEAEDDFLESLLNQKIDDTYGAIVGLQGVNLAPDEIKYLYSDVEFLDKAASELKMKIDTDNGVKTIIGDDIKFNLEILFQQIHELERELELKKVNKMDFTQDRAKIIKSIDDARKEAGKWVDKHYLWELHPSVKIISELVESIYDKDHLPCVLIDKEEGLSAPTFLCVGAIANKQGQSLKSEMVAISESSGQFKFEDGMTLINEIGFGKFNVPNASDKTKTGAKLKEYEKSFKTNLSNTIDAYTKHLKKIASEEHNNRRPKLDAYTKKIELWYAKKSEYLKSKYNGKHQVKRLEEELALAAKTKTNLTNYIKNEYEVEIKSPYVRPIALLIPDDGSWS